MLAGLGSWLSDHALALSLATLVMLSLVLYKARRNNEELAEQRLAAADVLRVISRSTIEPDAVLATLVGTAVRLWKVDAIEIVHHSGEGKNHVVHAGLQLHYSDYLTNVPLVPDRSYLIGRVLLGGDAIQI